MNTTNLDNIPSNVNEMLGLLNQNPVYNKKGQLMNTDYDLYGEPKSQLEQDLYGFQELLGGQAKMKEYFPFGGPLTNDLGRTDRPESYYPYVREGIRHISGSSYNQDNLAAAQGKGTEFINALGRVLPLTFFETLAGLGSMADTIDVFNILDNDSVNFAHQVNTWAEGKKQGVRDWAPIYEPTNSGMGDSSWWANNGSALAASATSFFVQGGVLGKALTSVRWADSIIKGLKAADRLTDSGNMLNKAISAASKMATAPNIDRFKAIQGLGNALATSVLMTSAESAMDATQVYNDSYQEALQRGYGEEAAKYIASEGAAAVYKNNRLNIALNMTSSLRFIQAFNGASRPIKAPTLGKGFWGQAYDGKTKLSKLAGIFKANKKYDPVLRDVVTEGTQESLEELVNLYSQQEGYAKAQGLMDTPDSDYFSAFKPGKLLGNILTKEGFESATLGFIGGAGQLGLTRGIIHNLPGLGGKVETRDAHGNLKYGEEDAVYSEDHEINKVGEILSNDIKLSDGTEYKTGDEVTTEMLTHAKAVGDKIVNKEGTTALQKATDGTTKPIKLTSDKPAFEDDGKKFSINKAMKRRFEQQQSILKNQEAVAQKVLKSVNDVHETSQIHVALDALQHMNNPQLDPADRAVLKDNLAKFMLKQAGEDYDTTVEDAAARKKAEENVKKKIKDLEKMSESEILATFNDVKQNLLVQQTKLAIENDFVDPLKAIYKDIANFTPEQAAERGMDVATYKKDAEKALSLIDSYANLYKEYRYKYDSVIASKLYDNRVKTESKYNDLKDINEEITTLQTKLDENVSLKDTDGKLANQKTDYEAKRKEIVDELEKLVKAQRELFQGTYKIEEGKSADSTKREVVVQANKLRSGLDSLDTDHQKVMSDLIKGDPTLTKLEELREKAKDTKDAIDAFDKRFEILRDHGKTRADKRAKRAEEDELSAKSLTGMIDFYDKFGEIYKQSTAKTHVVYFELGKENDADFAISYLISKYNKTNEEIFSNPDAFIAFVNENIDDALIYLSYNKTDAEITTLKSKVLSKLASPATYIGRDPDKFQSDLGIEISDTAIPMSIEFYPIESQESSDGRFSFKHGYFILVPLIEPVTYHTSATATKLAKLTLPGHDKPLFAVEKLDEYDNLYRVTLNDDKEFALKHEFADKVRVATQQDYDIANNKIRYQRGYKVIEQRTNKLKKEKNKAILDIKKTIEEKNKKIEDLAKEVETTIDEIAKTAEDLQKETEAVENAKKENKALRQLEKTIKKDARPEEERLIDLERVNEEIDKNIDVIVEHENKVKELQDKSEELADRIKRVDQEYKEALQTIDDDINKLTSDLSNITSELTSLNEVMDELSKGIYTTFSEVSSFYSLKDKLTSEIDKLESDLKILSEQAAIADVLLDKPKDGEELKTKLSTLATLQESVDLVNEILKEYDNLDESDFSLIETLVADIQEKKKGITDNLRDQKNQLEQLTSIYEDIEQLAEEEELNRQVLAARASRKIVKAVDEQQDPIDGQTTTGEAIDVPVTLEELYDGYGSESYYKSGEYLRTTSRDVHPDQADKVIDGHLYSVDKLDDQGSIIPNPSPRQRLNSKALNQIASERLVNDKTKKPLDNLELRVKYVFATDDSVKDELFYTDGNIDKEFRDAGIENNEKLTPFIKDISAFQKYLTAKETELGDLTQSQQQSFDRLKSLKDGSQFTIGLWDDLYRFVTNDKNSQREITGSGVKINGRGLYTVLGNLDADDKFRTVHVDSNKGTFTYEKSKGFYPIILTLHGKNRIADNNTQELAAKLYSHIWNTQWWSYDGLRNKILNGVDEAGVKHSAKLKATKTREEEDAVLKTIFISFGRDKKISVFTLDNIEQIAEMGETDKNEANEAFDFIVKEKQKILSEHQEKLSRITLSLDKGTVLLSNVTKISDGFVKRRQPKTDSDGTRTRDYSDLVGPDGAVSSVDDIVNFEIPIITKPNAGSTMAPIGNENEYTTTTRGLRQGKAYVRTKDGDIVSVFSKKLNPTQVDFVVSAIETEFKLLQAGELDPVKISVVMTEDGKELSKDQSIPLLRFSNEDPNKGLNIISRVLYWSGKPKEGRKKQQHSIFFWVNPKDNNKIYLSYGTKTEIAVEELLSDPDAMVAFKSWLSQRPLNLNKNFMGFTNYYEPLKVEKRGDAWVLIAKEYKETSPKKKNAYLNYLTQSGSLFSDTLSKDEAQKVGLNGERTVGRYLVLSEASSIADEKKKEVAAKTRKKELTGDKDKKTSEKGTPTTLVRKAKLIKSKDTLESVIYSGKLVKTISNKNKTKTYIFENNIKFTEVEGGEFVAKTITQEELDKVNAPNRVLDNATSTLKDIPLNTDILVKIESPFYEEGVKVYTTVFEFVVSRHVDNSNTQVFVGGASTENDRFDVRVNTKSQFNQVYKVFEDGTKEYRNPEALDKFLTGLQQMFDSPESAEIRMHAFSKMLLQRDAVSKVLPPLEGKTLLADSPLSTYDFLKTNSVVEDSNPDNAKNIIVESVVKDDVINNKKTESLIGNFSLTLNPKDTSVVEEISVVKNENATTYKDIESQIKIEEEHQQILNLLPDYSNVKVSIENDRGGLGFVGDFTARENALDNSLTISTTVKYSGIPSSEVYTHELLHYFTIPAFIAYKKNHLSKTSAGYKYIKDLNDLYEKSKSLGYTPINGVSIHDNLTEFAVNITNPKSVTKLKELGIYDELFDITKQYLQSFKTTSTEIEKIDKKINKLKAKIEKDSVEEDKNMLKAADIHRYIVGSFNVDSETKDLIIINESLETSSSPDSYYALFLDSEDPNKAYYSLIDFNETNSGTKDSFTNITKFLNATDIIADEDIDLTNPVPTKLLVTQTEGVLQKTPNGWKVIEKHSITLSKGNDGKITDSEQGKIEAEIQTLEIERSEAKNAEAVKQLPEAPKSRKELMVNYLNDLQIEGYSFAVTKNNRIKITTEKEYLSVGDFVEALLKNNDDVSKQVSSVLTALNKITKGNRSWKKIQLLPVDEDIYAAYTSNMQGTGTAVIKIGNLFNNGEVDTRLVMLHEIIHHYTKDLLDQYAKSSTDFTYSDELRAIVDNIKRNRDEVLTAYLNNKDLDKAFEEVDLATYLFGKNSITVVNTTSDTTNIIDLNELLAKFKKSNKKKTVTAEDFYNHLTEVTGNPDISFVTTTDLTEFVSGIFENSALQILASSITITKDGNIISIFEDLWNSIKDFFKQLIGIDIDPNSNLADSIKSVAQLISKGSDKLNLDDLPFSSFPKPISVDYNIIASKDVTYSSQVDTSFSMFPTPKKQGLESGDNKSSFEQVFNSYFDVNDSSIDAINQESIKLVISQEDSNIAQAKLLAKRIIEEDETQRLVPLLFKAAGIDDAGIRIMLEKSNLFDGIKQEIAQVGGDFEQIVRDSIHHYYFNDTILFPNTYEFLTNQLILTDNDLNLLEVVKSLYNLQKADPNNIVSEQLLSSLGKGVTFDEFDQQANDLQEILFSDGFRLTRPETISLFNGISVALFEELITKNNDPDKLLTIIESHEELFTLYDKILDDNIVPQIIARVDELESELQNNDLSQQQIQEYNKALERMNKMLSTYLFDPEHRAIITRNHALLELRAFSIVVDETAIDEYQRGKSISEYKDSVNYNTKDLAPPIVRLIVASVPKEKIKLSRIRINPDEYIKNYSIDNTDSYKFRDEEGIEMTATQYFEERIEELEAEKVKSNSQRDKTRISNDINTYKGYVANKRVLNFVPDIDNVFGFHRLEDYDRTYNLIQKLLKNSKVDFNTILDRIDELSTEQLSLNNGLFGLRHLVTKLRAINDDTSKHNNIIIRNAFIQAFTKTEQKHYVTLFDENGDIFSLEANAENIKTIMLNRWNRNLNTKLKQYNDANITEDLAATSDKLIFTNEYFEEIKAVFNRTHRNPDYIRNNEVDRLELTLSMLGIEVGNFKRFLNLFNSVSKEKLNAYVSNMLDYIETAEPAIIGNKSNIYATSSPVRGRLNTLIGIASKTITEVYENQYLNPNNETVHTLSLYHYITDVNDRLNSVNDPTVLEKYAPDLSGVEQKKKIISTFLPHLLNVYTRNSILLNKLLSGENFTLESTVHSGIRANTLFDIGKETQDLSPADLYAQRLNGGLNGIFTFSQTADRKLSNGLKLVPNNQTLEQEESVSSSLLFNDVNEAVNGFLNYLVDELNLMIHTRVYPDNKIIYYNDKADVKNTKSAKFRYFDGILSTDTKNKLTQLVEQEADNSDFIVDRKSLEDLLKEMFTDENLTNKIKSEIKEHFKKSIAKTRANLDKFGITDVRPYEEVTINNKKVYKPRFQIDATKDDTVNVNGFIGISNNIYDSYLKRYKDSGIPVNDLAEFVLNKMIEVFIINQEGMYIEQSKLFFGDPAFFKNEDDIFKRYKMFTSTKQVSVDDAHLNQAFNDNNYILEKNIETNEVTRLDVKNTDFKTINDTDEILHVIGWGYRSDQKVYDGSINTAVIRDIKVFSSYAYNGTPIEKITYKSGKLHYFDGDNNELTTIPPIVKGFAESFIADGITDNNLLSSKVMSYVSAYMGYEETDGQGFITLDEYKELMIRNGLGWTDNHQRAYFKALQGKILTLDELALFQPLKTQYTGPIVDFIHKDSQNNVDEDRTLFVPTGYKHSLVPLIPSAVKDTQFEKLLDYLREKQIGIVQFVSGNKYGTKLNSDGSLNELYDENGLINEEQVKNWNTQKILYDFIGIQVNIQPKTKGYTPVGSQPRKLLLINSYENGLLVRDLQNKEPLIQRYIDLQEEIITRKLEQLKDDLGIIEITNKSGEKRYRITDFNRLVNILLNEAQDRGNPINVQRSILSLAIEYTRALNRNVGKKGAYVEEVLNRQKIENILNAIFNSRIFREKRPGEAFVQVTSAGTEMSAKTFTNYKGDKVFTTGSNLLYYEPGIDALTGEEATVPAEIMVPLPKKWMPWVEKMGGLSTFNRRLDALFNKLNKIERPGFSSEEDTIVDLTADEKNLVQLLTVVGFRIPNQALNSTDALRIRRFLPTESGISAVVPSEIVPKTGGDFDVDKIESYLSSFDLDPKTGRPIYTVYIEDINTITDGAKLELFKERIREQYKSEELDNMSLTIFDEDLDTYEELVKDRRTINTEKKELRQVIKFANQSILSKRDELDLVYKEGYSFFRELDKGAKQPFYNADKDADVKGLSSVQKQEFMLNIALTFINDLKNVAQRDGSVEDDKISSSYTVSLEYTDRKGNPIIEEANVNDTIDTLNQMVDNYAEWIRIFYNLTNKQIDEHLNDLISTIKEDSDTSNNAIKQRDYASKLLKQQIEKVIDINNKLTAINIKFYETLASAKETIPFNTFDQFKREFNGNHIRFNRSNSIYNNMIEVQHDILRLPYNYRQLVAPITDSNLVGAEHGVVWDIRFLEAWNKNSDNYFDKGANVLAEFLEKSKDLDENAYNALYQTYRSKFIDTWRKDFISEKSLTHVISHENNINKLKVFSVGKLNVGIVARHVTHNALSQQVDLMLNSPILIDSKFNINNNANIYFDSNLSLIRNGRKVPFDYTLSQVYKFEKKEDGLYNDKGKKILNAGDQLFISFSHIKDLDKNYISETLSAFVNAYVDVSKDPYVFDMNGVTALANTYFMMIRSGASLKFISKFLNQPIIKEYLNAQSKNESAFAVVNQLTLSKAALAISVMNRFDPTAKNQRFYSTTEWYNMSYEDRFKIVKALRGSSRLDWDVVNKNDSIRSRVLDNYDDYRDEYSQYQERESKKKLLYLAKQEALKSEEVFKNGSYSNFLEIHEPLKKLDTYLSTKLNSLTAKRLDQMLTTDFKTNTDQGLAEDQIAILNMFLEYQRTSGMLRDAMNATSADTYGLAKNIEEVKTYLNKSRTFINQQHFRNLEKIDQQTVIKPYKAVIDLAYQIYSPLYLIESNEVISEYLDTIKDTVIIAKPSNKHGSIKDTVNNEFINFILHSDFGGPTYIDHEYVYKALVRGELYKEKMRYSILVDNVRVPISLIQLMNHLSSSSSLDLSRMNIQIVTGNNITILNDKTFFDRLKDNAFIREIVSDPSEENYSWDDFIGKKHKSSRQNLPTLAGKMNSTLTLLSRTRTTQQQNELTKGLEEIRELLPDLYQDLIIMSIGQNGVGLTPGSYFSLIPANDYIRLSMPLIDHVASMNHNDLLDYLQQFERQFWHRKIELLPRVPKSGRISVNSVIARYPAAVRFYYNDKTERREAVLLFADHINTDTVRSRGEKAPDVISYSVARPIVGNRHRFVGYSYKYDKTKDSLRTILNTYGKDQLVAKVPELMLPSIDASTLEPVFNRVFNNNVISSLRQQLQTVIASDTNLFKNLKEGDKARITFEGNDYIITYLGEKNSTIASQLLTKAAQRRADHDLNFEDSGDLSNFEIAYGHISSTDSIKDFIKDTSIKRHIYEVEKLNILAKMQDLKPIALIPRGWATTGTKVTTAEYNDSDTVSITSNSENPEARQFSAMNARLKDGRLIEEIYQLDIKGYGVASPRHQGASTFFFGDYKKGKGKTINRKLHNVKKVETKEQADKLKQAAGNLNPIMVVGTNIEGKHGKGAAKSAQDYFGAVYGQAEGLQGNAYGLITKDLKRGEKSLTKDQISENIATLYQNAIDNPGNGYLVAYSLQQGNPDKKGLNGYSTQEMAQMFAGANGYLTKIPDNIIFENDFAYLVAYEQYKNLFKQYLLKDYPDKFATLSKLATDKVLTDVYSRETKPYRSVNQARALYEILMEENNKSASTPNVITNNVKIHSMKYTMPALENNTGKDTTTLKLAEEGLRTATTRSYPLGSVGDIIMFEGGSKKYIITDVEKLTTENVNNPEWVKQWSSKEMWTVEHFNKILGGKTVHIGAYQTSFRIADESATASRITTPIFDPKQVVHFHGSADGSDIAFEEAIEKFGGKSVGYSFTGHSYKGKEGNINKVDEEINSLAENSLSLRAVKLVATFLARPFNPYTTDPKTKYVNKLLRRNYHQVKDAQAVYGVGTLVNATGKSYKVVDGGTGWGVAMGILAKRPVFVFDQEANAWYKWNYILEDFEIQQGPLKIEYNHFAGIGTRKLNTNGKKAIEDLVANTYADRNTSNFPAPLKKQNDEISDIVKRWEDQSEECN